MNIMLIPVGEQIKPLYEGFRYVPDLYEIILVYTDKTTDVAVELKAWAMKLVNRVRMVKTVATRVDEIISDILSECPETVLTDSSIISNLSGGTKPMSHACYVLSSIMNGRSFYIFLNNDGKMEYVEMPKLNVCVSDILSHSKKGSKTRIKLLIALEDHDLTLTELSRILKIKKPSVLAQIKKMENYGFLSYHNGVASILPTGRLILEVISIIDKRHKLAKLSNNYNNK